MKRGSSLIEMSVTIATLALVAACAVSIERIVLRPAASAPPSSHALDQAAERLRREARLGIVRANDAMRLGTAVYAISDGRLLRNGDAMLPDCHAAWTIDGAAVEVVLTPPRGAPRTLRLVAEARP